MLPKVVFLNRNKLTYLCKRVRTLVEINRFLAQYETNYSIFTKYFDLSRERALIYMENQVIKRHPEVVWRSIEFCESIGYQKNDILLHPSLMRTNSVTLEQRHMLLEEAGFVDVSADVLTAFLSLQKYKIGNLKSAGLIREKTDVAESIISYLNPCPRDFTIEHAGNEEILSELHKRIFVAYLKWKLDASYESIEKLVNIQKEVRHKSFRNLCENLRILEELGYTSDKILKSGYVLRQYPKYTRMVLEKYPVLAGVDMRKCMKNIPKFIGIAPWKIERIYKILQEHEIPDNIIQKHMLVFMLAPETVEYRLREIKRQAELKVLLTHDQLFRLVIHHNRSRSRLKQLKELDFKCTGLSIIAGDFETRFENQLKGGKDKNSCLDVDMFLKGLFHKDVTEFRQIRNHRFHREVPLLRMEETYLYLISKKFKPDSIYKVLPILLYSRTKIEGAIEQVASFRIDNKTDLSDVEVLNLILYFIEQEYRFSGEGVFREASSALMDVAG